MRLLIDHPEFDARMKFAAIERRPAAEASGTRALSLYLIFVASGFAGLIYESIRTTT